MSEHVNDMFMVGELPHVMQLRFYTLRLVAATFRNKHEIAFSEVCNLNSPSLFISTFH